MEGYNLIAVGMGQDLGLYMCYYCYDTRAAERELREGLHQQGPCCANCLVAFALLHAGLAGSMVQRVLLLGC
jgi:hypothetical protein